MPAPRRPTLAEQLADLDDPTPRDLDPEDHDNPFAAVDREADAAREAERAGRAHYQATNASELRARHGPDLGSQYAGAAVSRGKATIGESFPEDGSSDDDPFAAPLEQDSNDNNDISDAGSSDEDQTRFGRRDPSSRTTLAARASIPAAKNTGNKRQKVVNGQNHDRQANPKTGPGLMRERQSQRAVSSSTQESDDDDQDDSVSGSSNVGNGMSEDSGESVSGFSDDFDSDSDNEGHVEDVELARNETAQAERAQARALMATDFKSLVASLSQAVKDDVAKGIAVRQQQSTFNALLNTRIRLQKALVAANSLAVSPPAHNTASTTNHNAATIKNRTKATNGDLLQLLEAEKAALQLLQNLSQLRNSLNRTEAGSRKRPFPVDTSPSSAQLAEDLRLNEASARPIRRATISKWAEKTQPVTTLTARARLTQTQPPSLLEAVDTQLSPANIPRLIQRTRIARSCAPLQAASTPTPANKKPNRHQLDESTSTGTIVDAASPNVYDDADWYAQLLRDLVAAKTSTAASGAASMVALDSFDPADEAKALRQDEKTARHRTVDTKASKGRKMRYTVHEKLLNFMAPETSHTGWWEARQTDELFAGLLGRRVAGGLTEQAGDEDDDAASDLDECGLRLFRGQTA